MFYERLEEEGYDIEEGAFSPEAIIIKKGSAIEKNKLYQEGLITVQDEKMCIRDRNKGDYFGEIC